MGYKLEGIKHMYPNLKVSSTHLICHDPTLAPHPSATLFEAVSLSRLSKLPLDCTSSLTKQSLSLHSTFSLTHSMPPSLDSTSSLTRCIDRQDL